MPTPTHEALFDYKDGGYNPHHKTNIGNLGNILSADSDSHEFVIGVINAYTCLVARVSAENLAVVEDSKPLKIDMFGPNGTIEEFEIKASDPVLWVGFPKSD